MVFTNDGSWAKILTDGKKSLCEKGYTRILVDDSTNEVVKYITEQEAIERAKRVISRIKDK